MASQAPRKPLQRTVHNDIAKLKRGLTLGKYAPLHRGHQLVIETALSEMDETVAVIYDAPDVTSVPLAVRSRWLRELYPSLRIIEAHGPTRVGCTADIMRAHERYLIDTLGVQGITHFYSSEPYGEHMSIGGTGESRLANLATEAASRYDLTFVCDTDIPCENTWDRSGDVKRAAFQQRILADLDQRQIPFLVLQGSLEERVAHVCRVLARFHKHMDPRELLERTVA